MDCPKRSNGERERVRISRSLVAFAVCLVGLCANAYAAGEYRTIEVEALKITIDSEWATRTTPGYLPVRFDITNLGDARVIEIVSQGTRFFRRMGPPGGQQAGVEVRQTVRLARGDRVRLTLPVPVLADSETVRFEIREDGRALDRFSFTGFQSRSAPADASALIVADPSSAFATTASGWLRTFTGGGSGGFAILSGGVASGTVVSGGPTVRVSPSGGGRGSRPPLDFILDPGRLPTNWLGFTSLRAVFIGPKEWEQLNEAQRTALLTWTACGGDLMFVDGDVKTLVPGRTLPAGGTNRAAAYFFGRIHTPTAESISSGGLGSALSEAEKVQDSNWALPANRAADWGTIAARGFRLPIPGVNGVPARAYLMILFVFSVLIGPANYWLLWRKRRQVLLVLTTPLISAIFIVLLAGYVVAGEGLGVRGRAMSFTMLDEVKKQAATRATVSLYAAGMTPAGGLRFPRDVAVIAIGPEGTGSTERHALDLTESQRYASGVIQARSPTNLEEIGFRSARERLGFSKDADGLRVINGLGATITALIYRHGGQLYQLAGPLAQGEKGLMKIDPRSAASVVPPDLPQAARLQYLFTHQPDGSYLAVLDRSPFWEPGVAGVDERGSFHVVIGWPEGQP